MRDSLLWRMLGAQLLVIAIAVVISGGLITDLVSRSFMTIMARYNIEPVAVEAEFLASTHRVLLVSSLMAAAAAMLLGWILVRRLMRPLKRMMAMAECIAQGDYACRADLRGPARSPGWLMRSMGWRRACKGSKRSGGTSSPISRASCVRR